MSRTKRFLLGTFLFSCGIGLGVVGAMGAMHGGPDALQTEHIAGARHDAPRLFLLRVEGVIVAEKPKGAGGLFSGATVAANEVEASLRKAAADPTIRGVLVQFATPGGTPGGAQTIFDAIGEYRKTTGRPIVAHVEGMSASGGVWAMVGADEILADPGSLTGSIGVTLGQHQWYENPVAVTPGLLSGGVETRGGIHAYTLAAGKGKDMLSPFREPTAEELKVLQGALDRMYAQFVQHVSTARKISPEVIRNTMGAYVFDNEGAREFGLIDGTMTRSQALAHLAGKAGVAESYEVVGLQEERGGGVLGRILGTTGVASHAPVGLAACQAAAATVTAYFGDPSVLCR